MTIERRRLGAQQSVGLQHLPLRVTNRQELVQGEHDDAVRYDIAHLADHFQSEMYVVMKVHHGGIEALEQRAELLVDDAALGLRMAKMIHRRRAEQDLAAVGGAIRERRPGMAR